MKTLLYYYTGAGNSLWVARTIAAKLGETEVIPMAGTGDTVDVTGADRVGLVFPIHMWGAPPLVNTFISRLKGGRDTWFFAVAVNAGAVAASLKRLKNQFKKRGMALSAGFSVIMPSIYLPFGDIIPEEKQQQLFENGKEKMDVIADALKERHVMEVEAGPFWQNLIFSGLNSLVKYQVPRMDRSFLADEKCNGCGVCGKVCPVNNIQLSDGRPVWLHHCEQCFACLHWCPEEAIQYGKSTTTKKRYHHPEITLVDMTSRPRQSGAADE